MTIALLSPPVFIEKIVCSISENAQTKEYIYLNIQKNIENFSGNVSVFWIAQGEAFAYITIIVFRNKKLVFLVLVFFFFHSYLNFFILFFFSENDVLFNTLQAILNLSKLAELYQYVKQK